MNFKYKNYFYYFNKKKNDTFLKRSKQIILILFLALIISISNIYKLQIINFQYYSSLSKNNYTRLVPSIPYRGIIFDRNKKPVVINKNYYYLTIKINQINKIKKIRKILEKNFLLSKKKINNLIKIYKNNLNKNIIIKKYLNNKDIIEYYKNKSILKYIYLKKNKYRFYPYKNILSHVIGYTSKDKNNKNYIGKNGIEKYYDNILRGKYGIKKIIFNNKGEILNTTNIKKSYAGKNIYLTIDINTQKFIYKLVKNNQSSIIISNPNNGEIYSLISTPGYNPNFFTKNISNKKYKKIINNPYSSLINKTIQGIYPPASTIKPYIGLAALHNKIISTKHIMFDPGWWKLPKYKKIFYDWKTLGHGLINIRKSIEESSDTFYYHIAYNMGIKNLIKWIKKFGYGKKTGIDLPNENIGYLPKKEIIKKNNWYIGNTILIGIGQGNLAITPIQMNKALLILINNGLIINPHLLKNIENKVYSKLYIKKIKNIKKKYWKIIKKSMYGVACKKNGTAYKNFLNTKYKIATKSGTAQIISLQKNYFLKNKNFIFQDHTLMNAFIPYKKPNFAISIVLEHGGNGPRIGYIMRKITDFLYKNQKLILKKNILYDKKN